MNLDLVGEAPAPAEGPALAAPPVRPEPATPISADAREGSAESGAAEEMQAHRDSRGLSAVLATAGSPAADGVSLSVEAPLSARFFAAQARAIAVHDIASLTKAPKGQACPVLLRIADTSESAGLAPLLAGDGDLRLAFFSDPSGPGRAEWPARLVMEGFALFHVDDTADAFRRLRVPDDISAGWIYATRLARTASGLFFAHSADLGGAERSLLELLEELAGDRGSPCTLIVPGEGPLAAAARRAGAAVLVDPRLVQWCTYGDPPEPSALARILSEGTAALLELLPTLRAIDPDIVFTQTMSVPWGAAAAAWLGRPHLWSVCEYGQRDHDMQFGRPFDELLADLAAGGHLIVPSQRLAQMLFPGVAATVIPRHIDVDVMTIAEDGSHFRRRGARRIGLFGAMHEGKGQLDAIMALAELVRRGHDAELLLAGTQEPAYAQALRLMAHQFGVTDRVVIRDFLPSPYGAMLACDVLLVCSRAEAFGRVVAEGMLLGRPVVYPRNSGMAEFMTDGVTGLAYEPGDVTALVDHVAALLGDPAGRAAMGDAARKQAQARLTRDAYGGAIFRLMLALRDEAQPAPHLPRPVQAVVLDLLEKQRHALQRAEDLQAEAARLTERLVATEATQAAAQAAQAAILSSGSWRVTAPLRKLGRRVPMLGRMARAVMRQWRSLTHRDQAATMSPEPSRPHLSEAAFPAGRVAQWRWAIRRIRFMYHQSNGRWPALFRPRRFTEKVQWRKLFELNPNFALLSDKLASREWVGARLGSGHQAQLLWVGSDPALIPFDTLPMPCVLKSTHASGHVIRLNAQSDRDAVRAKAAAWLEHRFGLNMVEPGYIPVTPRLIVEERLTKPDGGPLSEYRVMVFNGVTRLIQVTDIDASDESRTLGFFDRDWQSQPIYLISTERPPSVERPARLEELLSVAERLAAGLDYARVDFFDCGDRLMVGEITLYPWSGLLPFRDPAQDLALGAMWRLRWPLVRAAWALAFRRWAIKPPLGAPRL